MESTDQEIRREKVFIPPGMSVNEIQEKYGISKSSARTSFKRGWFIKNYSRNQIQIDRENFHPASAYSIAKQVFWKRFRNIPTAVSIKEDMIQEAVSLMFMQSGKVKAGANEKYSEKYGYFWCAYNGMLAYLDKWIRQTKYDVELHDEYHPMMYDGNRRWSPESGWGYC